MRTVKKVIKRITKSLDMLDHMGYGVEPIAVAADPENVVEADYVIHVCFETDIGDGNLYMQQFQGYIDMRNFQTMSEEQFKYNLVKLRLDAINWRNRAVTRGHSVTKDGIVDVSSILKKARESIEH